jgi:uncharacterized protein (DUF1697 family)
MTIFVILLRAINVGGEGALPMSELKEICANAGFGEVQTYIASGNVVMGSDLPEKKVKAALEKQLELATGRRVGVLVRTLGEITEVLRLNPYPDALPNRTVAIFLDKTPSKASLEAAKGSSGEEMSLGVREIYVHYPSGIGASKLKIPEAATGTARNMNTIAKLIEMARAMEA